MCEAPNANRLFTGVNSVFRANEPDSPVNVESADFTLHYFTLRIDYDEGNFVDMFYN